MAMSASLPGSRLPFLCCRLRAQAPLMVAAVMASAGDIFMCVQATERTNGIDVVGEVPGL